MSDEVLFVFAGAGASKAVGADRYPTTLEFFERLPDSVKGTPFFKLLVKYLQGRSASDDVIDIEQVLWALDEILRFVEQAHDQSTVAGWFLAGNRLSEVMSGKQDLGPMTVVAKQSAVPLRQLQDAIYRQVYRWYSQPPNAEDLSDNWIMLLRSMISSGSQVEIFTTNYDLVIEAAAEEVNRISDLPDIALGRSGSLLPYLDEDIWATAANTLALPSGAGGLLTKLHGSVDWSKGDGRIHVGEPLFKGDHKRHVIVYPGFKGVPIESPFNRFHNRLEVALNEASAMLFIGFAFRDDYVNDLLTRFGRPRCPIIVLNPAEQLPGLPFDPEEVDHMKEYFDSESVKKCLERMNIAITA